MADGLVFSLDKFYELKNDGTDIKLDVVIGDKGQSPDMSVKLNKKNLITSTNQSIKALVVGNDKNLDGAVLRISGNIADTNRESNKMSLALKVSGGVSPLTKKFSITADEDGEVVIFSLVVRFFV